MAYRPVLLLLALLLTLCSSCASADETDTLQFLQSFAASYPVALSSWTGSNYCSWDYIRCDGDDVLLSISNRPLDANGTLPDVVTDGVLLTNIYLGSCFTTPTTLPASWSRMSRLVTMTLEYNQLTGTLPAEWSKLQNLNVFSLYRTSVTGTLPPEWGQLNVSIMNIAESPITGTLPPEWGTMAKLRVMDLSILPVGGTLPVAWLLMSNLYRLSLYNTSVGGTLPAEWGYSGVLPALESLTLKNSPFCGCEPETWKKRNVLHTAVQNTPLADDNCSTLNACPAQSNCADTTTKQPADTTTKQPGPDVTEKPGRDGARGRLGSSAVTAVTAVCVIALGLCL